MLKEKLTKPQESIWVTEQYYKGSSVNNICGTAIIEEKVDFELLEKAIEVVCEKNDNFKLRIEIENGEVKQIISDSENESIDIINIVDSKELEKEREKIVQTPFKIEKSPLYKFYIFKFANGTGAFMLNIHHLIADGWTLAFICNEIVKIYSRLKQGEEIENSDVYSYIDYINSEKEYQKSEKYQKDKAYWEEKFATIPEVAIIPGSEKENNNKDDAKGKRRQFNLDAKIVTNLKKYCKENNISLYNFFMAIYATYIGEITNLDDFVIGTPILNRTNFKEKNTAGMFINMVPLRINLEGVNDFKTFIKNISRDSLNMLKHQKYSYQSLLENLRKTQKSVPNLYNILVSYQITNAQTEEGNIKYKTDWTFNGCCAEDIDIQIYDLNDTGSLNVSYDYKTSIYEEKDIENIHKRILNIINQVINNENIEIKDIEIVTPEEKKQLVQDFNKTELEYDRTETVIKLFEKQVEKQPNKIALISNEQKLTYKELNDKSNQLARNMILKGVNPKDIVGIMLNRSPEMIIGLLAILKCGATYLPIDPEYPTERINYMIENSETKTLLVNSNTEKYVPRNCLKINIELSNTEIYNNKIDSKNINIQSESNTLAYMIYTSGSTGKPKGVMITNQNLTNFVKGMEQIIDFNPNKVMMSVTTMCFDIFGLEMWCSLANGLTLVLANEEEQRNMMLLNKLCIDNNVNMIQTTPSRFSVMFEEEKNIAFMKNVTEILVGGEGVGYKLLNQMQQKTNARIFNMYGPTETTIWSTVKELTKSKEITIGKPIANTQCYILNKNRKLLPIGVRGELYIGGDGVTKGYLKRDELNQEKFIPSPFRENAKIYNTNDLAYYKENGEIVHLGRTDFQVKIRGYRIELGEIENCIEQNKNVIQSVVVKKSISNNHDILVAYYTSKENKNIETDLRKLVSEKLPQYMVPQYFVKLDEMPHTPNGKVDRKALPEPMFNDVEKTIIKPRNDIDKQLIKIIEKILNIENISIDDTLIDLGGDSLTAITLSTKILSKFNVQISIKDILSKSLQEISDSIENTDSQEDMYFKIKKAEKQETYPLSSAQRRIYYNVKMIGENNTVYNMPGAILVDGLLDEQKVKTVFERIIERHEILRTKFILNDDEIRQKIEDKVSIEIPTYKNSEDEINSIINSFAQPFDLEELPLIRVELHYIDNKKTLLLVDTHHIVMDGTGLNNLINEFNKLYSNERLPQLPIQYKDYAVWEENYNQLEEVKKYEDYWLEKFKDSELSQLNLPYDYNLSVNRTYKGNKVIQTIDENIFKDIEEYSKSIGVSPYVLFISALFVLLYKYTGQDDINIGSPIANRNNDETKQILGMFVNNIVIRGKINSNSTFQEFTNRIKEQTLDDLSNQPYPFDMLVKKLGITMQMSRNPLFDVMFTYQNEGQEIVEIENKNCEIIEIDNKISKFNISIEIKPNTHTINIEYSTDLFKKQTIERMYEHYINTLKTIINNKNVQIKDIEVISEKEKNKILYEFNDTKTEYSRDKTIVELFEEQVQKTPEKTAIVFEDEKLTYKELNEKANQIANYLRNNGVKANDIIGVMLPRSLELIVSILGVVKAGACYIPIDPTYPEKRIEYMLENSNAKILITNEDLYCKIEYKNKVCADFNNTKIYQNNNKNIKTITDLEDLAYVIYTSGSTGKPKGVKITNGNLLNFIKGVKRVINFNKNKVMVSVTTICFDIFGLELWGTLTSGMTLVIASEEEQNMPALLNKLCVENNVNMIQTTPSRFSLILEEKENLKFLNNMTDILVGGEQLLEKVLIDLQQNTKARIYNMYGPTETTIWSTVKEVTNEKSITIGYPISNTQLYVLDENMKILPIGIVGELYIGGDGVSKGYLNRDDITKERFVKNPYDESSIIYKTGDICKFDEKGELYCLGRADNQVKVRGLRIELEEIEDKLLDFPGINKAKVVKQVIGNREIISAYYIAKKRIKITELRNYLYNYLPNYMIPSYFTPLDEFPYTPNGKIDKNALPIPNGILQTEKKIYKAPSTDLEVKLVILWEEILNTKPIGTQDNFFELGGDSILAMNLNIKLLKITDKIKYSDIFAYPTIMELAQKIESHLEEKAEEDLSNLNDKYKDILKYNMTMPNNVEYMPIGNILLTGATGYLGMHILDEFLKREKGKIYVLIRKEPGMEIREKFINKLHYYFEEKYDKYIDDRIIVIEGKISEDGFGLGQEELFKLANSVDVIVNSAAKVSHYGSYQEFYNINVKSVDKIIDFANTFKKKIFHISTLSISGNAFVDYHYIKQEIKEQIDFDESKFFIGQNLENVYVRSKFEAERRILDAILKGTDAYILRMGNLMPRLSDGKFQENIEENAYMNRIKTFVNLGYIPEYLMNEYLELTPIDITARSVLKIMQYTNSNNRIYHIFNHNYIFVKELLEILNEINYNIQVIDNQKFKNNIKAILNSSKSEILNTLINDFDKDLNLNYDGNIKLNSKHSIELLQLYGFKWPKISKEYINNILKLIKGEL